MALQSSNFSESLDVGIETWYGEEYNLYPEEFSKIFEVRYSNKAYEDSVAYTGVGEIPEVAEGQNISYDDPIQSFKQTLNHVKYGLGIKITEEMVDDEQYGLIESMVRSLAKSAKTTRERVAANVLNRGFNSAYTGPDSIELFSSVHKRADGGTFSNEPATPADLDMTSLEQALVDIAAFVDDRGLEVQAKGLCLVVPPALEWTAKRLLRSSGDPETANRSMNPAEGILPKGYVVNHYLTDPDAWFLKTDVLDGLVFFWRKQPKFAKDNDFDSENHKYKCSMRFITGWNNPRGAYGSSGSGS